MHRIWFHDSVFLIRPTSTHNNTLQVILKISIFRFADSRSTNGKKSIAKRTNSIAKTCIIIIIIIFQQIK